MIVGIRGILEAKGDSHVHLRVGGVTLLVAVPSSVVGQAGGVGEEAYLHTHMIIRDSEAVLYGFATEADLNLFQLLLTVSGVGPRTALSLLSSLPAQSLVGAIRSGDEQALSRVTGVGKRGSARIVLELKGKLGSYLDDGVSPVGEQEAAVSALTALGYSTSEAMRALSTAGGGADLPLEERLRRVLQNMGGGA